MEENEKVEMKEVEEFKPLTMMEQFEIERENIISEERELQIIAAILRRSDEGFASHLSYPYEHYKNARRRLNLMIRHLTQKLPNESDD